MKIICLLLCTLSLSTARVYPRTEVNDDLNKVEGFIYDIPQYEDPDAILFKLLARGVMPVYTARDTVKDLKDLSNKNDTPHHQTDDITKGLDTVITQLQEAKNKLESGNNAIYFDIDKSVLSLENLKQRLYADLLNVSTVWSLVDDATTERPLIYNATTERPLIYNATTERPLIYNASTERPLINNVSTELHPVNDAAITKQPFVMKEAVFAYVPAAEFTSDEEEVKTDTAVDEISSAEADKAAEGDKSLIRKKWSYKLSSLL